VGKMIDLSIVTPALEAGFEQAQGRNIIYKKGIE